MIDEAEWAEDTFGGCELGDVRRTKRLVDIGRRLAQRAGDSMAQCCDGDAAAQLGSYRFLRNEHGDAEAIAETSFAATARLAARDARITVGGRRHLDAAIFSSCQSRVGPRGECARFKDRRLLGAFGAIAGSRKRRDGGSGRTALVEPATSGAWSGPPAQTACVCEQGESPMARRAATRQRAAESNHDVPLSVSDRESDIYEYLAYKQDQHQRFVVRVSMDRRTKAGQRLFE